jgi:hypothetical protein
LRGRSGGEVRPDLAHDALKRGLSTCGFDLGDLGAFQRQISDQTLFTEHKSKDGLPGDGAIGAAMSLSSISVIINALRLRNAKL